ncbi:hypothetical protein PWG71_17435 [Nocardiopsis sp. N85]|uniref:hypothetical protein n=1 Tax=Nocardiopsis sp. N85 TaxID=3029400 RepID=UPI00237FC4D6|nr:hypothetical protein [Nocardiopsis sp. N85]MDE3723178.1 hypothetical protein [Nocardiopsis sp. N85]
MARGKRGGENEDKGAEDLGDAPTSVIYPRSGRRVVSEDFPLRGFTRHANADVDPNARRQAERSRAFRAKEKRNGNSPS